MSISSALNVIDGILKPPKTLDDKRYVISTELLIPIKILCQGSDEAAFDISRHLDYSLSSSKNLVVSTRCLVIMDFLMPVTACRSFVNDHTKTIVDKFKSRPSIKTKKLLEEFKEKCKFYIELWDISYHDSCPHISVTRRYLEDSLRCDMPRLEEKAKQHNVQKVENQQIEDKKVLLRCKELVNGSIVSDIEDIRTALDSLRNLLLIVFPFNIDFRASGTSMANSTAADATTSSSYHVNRNGTVIATDGYSRIKSDQLCFVDEDGEVIDFIEDDEDDEHNMNKSSECVENLNQYNDADDAGVDDYNDVEWEEDESDSNVAEFSPKRQKTFMDENYATGVSKASNSNVLAALGSVPYAIELTVPTGAGGVASSDNEAVLVNAREIAKQMSNHALPRLTTWYETLHRALLVILDSEKNTHVSSSSSKKSTSATSTSASLIYSDSRRLEHLTEQISTLTDEVKSVLESRYKELLFPH